MTSRTSSMDWFSDLIDRFDELPKGVRIALMLGGFIIFWPIGLAILAYLLWSGQMNCSMKRGRSHYRSWAGHGSGRRRSSGNRAFDEYRDATLKQLEEDQLEFSKFLDQLRRAKDQQEFDTFMSERMRKKREENGREPRPDEGSPAS